MKKTMRATFIIGALFRLSYIIKCNRGGIYSSSKKKSIKGKIFIVIWFVERDVRQRGGRELGER